VTTMASGRESGATGKASHRGHGGHRGGIGVGGQEFDHSIGDNHGVWARIGRNGESIAQRSPKGIAGGGRNLIGKITASGRETALRAILFAWVLTVDAREFTTDLSSTAPISPLRGLCDLCAMQSSLGWFSQLTPSCSLRTYRPPLQFPPLWPL
jgi:hypothetical protein